MTPTLLCGNILCEIDEVGSQHPSCHSDNASHMEPYIFSSSKNKIPNQCLWKNKIAVDHASGSGTSSDCTDTGGSNSRSCTH